MAFDYTPPSYTHTFSSGKTITLLPINVDNLPALIERNVELMEIVFEGGTSAAEIIRRAPRLAADLIAFSAGEPDATNKAASLPFPVQLLLLTEVYRLTFSEIPAGNAVRLLTEMFTNLKKPTPPHLDI
ncbi:MAG: hypothetical protein C0607_16080 [Azoarcus sp.]|nr:MAG: hypothetical protein C0607_16080 [Azoarcus sp.]